MDKDLIKFQEYFETLTAKYNAVSFGLSDMIHGIISDLRKEGKPIEFDKGICFGKMCPTGGMEEPVHIEGIHFNDDIGALVDCLTTSNNRVTCHISRMKFTTDEKYNFLKEILKKVSEK